MGMYTELIFGATLRENTPKYVIDAFNHIINDGDKDIKLSDEAEQFIDEYSLSRLVWSTSYYFGANINTPTFTFDKTGERWCISFRANLKNYGGVIEKFVEFIKPYIEYGSGPTNIFASVQYEEDDYPTLYGTEDKYDYLDKERISADRKYAYELINIVNELYNFGSPDLVVDENKLKEYNIDKDDLNTLDVYRMMVDVIKKRLKGEGVTEDFERLVDENSELKDKLRFSEVYLKQSKEKVKQLEEEIAYVRSL